MNLTWNPLNKTDSELYKGIAIFMIVIHNFMHMFPLPKENEFSYSSDRFINLLMIMKYDPLNMIQALFSFFGHFGVQIFIFLSAYGLTKKYSNQAFIYWPYIKNRISKIYPIFILSMLIWVIIAGWFNGNINPNKDASYVFNGYGLLGPLKLIYWHFDSLVLKLSLMSNFFPNKSLSPVGPWWFIPFIFQFYFIFPVFLYFYTKWGELSLLLMSLVSIALVIILKGEIFEVNLYFTILGHIPEFSLGVYLSKKKSFKVSSPYFIFFTIVFVFLLGNLNEYLWYINHICFLILLLLLFGYIVPKIYKIKILYKIVLFFGTVSLPLFLVNGFLREPFVSWAISYNNWLLTIFFCLMSLLCSILCSVFLLRIERKLIKFLKAQNNYFFKR